MNIYAHGGIRTRNLSKRVAADLRLIPGGQWDRQVNSSSKSGLVIANVTQGTGAAREEAATMLTELASSTKIAQKCVTMTGFIGTAAVWKSF